MNAKKGSISGRSSQHGAKGTFAKERQASADEKALVVAKIKASTQETKTITIQEEAGKFPATASARYSAIDISNGTNCVATVIQACVADICVQKPFTFTGANKVNTTLTPCGVSYYLWWLAFTHFRRVKCLTGAGYNDPLFVEASRDCDLPIALAKLLEYFGPYTDSSTGATHQRMVLWTAWPTLASGSATSLVNTASDFVRRTPDGAKCIRAWTSQKGEAAFNGVNLTEDMTLATIIANQAMYDEFISGLTGVCKLGAIPSVAPDASACAEIDTAYSFVTCPSSYFDEEVALVMNSRSLNRASSSFYVKPYIADRWFAGPGDTLQTGFTNQGGGALQDKWVYILNKCSWLPGKVRKMIKTFAFGPLETMQLTSIPINFSIFNSILGATMENEADRTLPTTEAEIFFFASFCKQALYARLAPHSWLGMYCASLVTYSVNTLDVDTSILRNPLPPLIANYISSIGPVVASGRLYLPVSAVVDPFFWFSANNTMVTNLAAFSLGFRSSTCAYVAVIPTVTVNTTSELAMFRPHTSYLCTPGVAAYYRNAPFAQQVFKTATTPTLFALGSAQMLMTLKSTNFGFSSNSYTVNANSYVNNSIPVYLGVYSPIRFSVQDMLKAPQMSIMCTYGFDAGTQEAEQLAVGCYYAFPLGFEALYMTCMLFDMDAVINAIGVARGEGLTRRQGLSGMRVVQKVINENAANMDAPGTTEDWMHYGYGHVKGLLSATYQMAEDRYGSSYSKGGVHGLWKRIASDINSSVMTVAQGVQLYRSLMGGPMGGSTNRLIEDMPRVIIEEVN